MYRWVDHTAELELDIEADTAEAVFAEAAAALRELLGEGEAAGTRTVAVEAPDRAAQLAAFMEELVFLSESESLIPSGVGGVELHDAGVTADVEVARGDPPSLVKAVTYHRLTFGRRGDGYGATVVLDV